MLTLDALDDRRSTPTRQLGEPGPDDAQLLRITGSRQRRLSGNRPAGRDQ